jgi:hypothetical protein
MSERATDEMRKAAAAGDWPAVLRLWEQYAAGIRGELAGRACTHARLLEAREFLDWARRIALCARAQNQQQLDAIHAAQQYGPQPSQRRPALHTSL